MKRASEKLVIEVYPPVNGNQYITLAGRLDTHSHAALEERLAPLLAGKPHALVLDLAHLEYISSAGVRCILKARKSLAPHEGGGADHRGLERDCVRLVASGCQVGSKVEFGWQV